MSNKVTILVIFSWFWAIASWFTHIVACLQDSAWGFLVAGAIFFPVAWIHGTGVWFGAW